jgi:hypothetical protein
MDELERFSSFESSLTHNANNTSKNTPVVNSKNFNPNKYDNHMLILLLIIHQTLVLQFSIVCKNFRT